MNPVEHARAALYVGRGVVRAFGFGLLTPIIVLAAFSTVLNPIRLAAQEPAKLVAAAERLSPASIASPDEIGRWIDELGHDAFTVRQAAASQLLSAGMSAREPLLAIVDGPDPERRAAARRLIALIDQSDFHRRLEAFAADTDGRQHLTLPGWDQYQKLVGSDPAARALFVEMQRHEGPLIAALFGASKQAPNHALESRLVRLVQWQNLGGNRSVSPPLGSSAALLFLGSVADIDMSDDAAALIALLLQRSPFPETLRSDNRQDATRRLAVAWLLHCPTKNENILQQRLSTISNNGLEEALPLPLAVIGGEGPYKRTQPITRAVAALVIGQFGGAEHVDRLEPLLADTSICNGNGLQQQLPGQQAVQVRDVALVVMLQLTGQKPADYGYINARNQPQRAFQLQSLSRDNDQQRNEAIAKWRQWRAASKNASEPEKLK
jgi:hypothetical protein